MSTSICGQRRPSQPNQGLHCPQLKSLDTIAYFNGGQMPGWDFTHEQNDVNLHILHMLQGTFLLDMAHLIPYPTDVDLSNFITCPRTSKWSKSTCPSKIYLPENWHFFLFLEENICFGYSLEAPHRGTSNEYPQHMFSSRIKKNIYLIIWIFFCQSYKLLVPGQVNWNFLLVLREMGQVGQVGHGISTALPTLTINPCNFIQVS